MTPNSGASPTDAGNVLARQKLPYKPRYQKNDLMEDQTAGHGQVGILGDCVFLSQALFSQSGRSSRSVIGIILAAKY